MKKIFLIIILLTSTISYGQTQFSEVYQNLMLYFDYQDKYKCWHSESWVDDEIEECNPSTMLGSGTYGWRRTDASWDSNTTIPYSGSHCILVNKTADNGGAWTTGTYMGWSKRNWGPDFDSMLVTVYVYIPEGGDIDTLFFGMGDDYRRPLAETITDEDTCTTIGEWTKMSIKFFRGDQSYIYITSPPTQHDTFYFDYFSIKSKVFIDRSIYGNYNVVEYVLDNDTVGHKPNRDALKLDRDESWEVYMYGEDANHLDFSKNSTDSSDQPSTFVFFGNIHDLGYNMGIIEKYGAEKQWYWFKETNDLIYLRVFDVNNNKRWIYAPTQIVRDSMPQGGFYSLMFCYNGKDEFKFYYNGQPYTTNVATGFEANYSGMSPSVDYPVYFFKGTHKMDGEAEAVMIYKEYISDEKALTIHRHLTR